MKKASEARTERQKVAGGVGHAVVHLNRKLSLGSGAFDLELGGTHVGSGDGTRDMALLAVCREP